MTIITKYMTDNPCYKAGKTIQPTGVMVHSTAAPGTMASDWFERWNKSDVEKCVHAFVDNTVVMQYLPWKHRGWHCGVGTSGMSGNNTHVAFEVCEPSDMVLYYQNTIKRGEFADSRAVKAVQQQLLAKGLYLGNIDGEYGGASELAMKKYQTSKGLTADGVCGKNTWKALAAEPERLCAYNPEKNKAYFDAAWNNAVELTAMLCIENGINESGVICHSEGYAKGIATNHADIMHWIPLHGKNMDMFRADVAKEIKAAQGENQSGRPDLATVAAAIDNLARLGELNTPDYWKAHYKELANVDYLLIGYSNCASKAIK